jgi:predicted dehydrogenase
MIVTNPRGSRTEDVRPKAPTWGSEQWALIQESVVTTQAHWLDCFESGIEPEVSGADNLRTFALVEACYTSAISGKPERPPA